MLKKTKKTETAKPIGRKARTGAAYIRKYKIYLNRYDKEKNVFTIVEWYSILGAKQKLQSDIGKKLGTYVSLSHMIVERING